MSTQIINSLSNEEYHFGEQYNQYWSSTNLKGYLKSPKHAHYFKNNPKGNVGGEGASNGSIFHDYMESMIKRGDLSLFHETHDLFEVPINSSTGKEYGFTSKKYQEAYEGLNNPYTESQLKLADTLFNSWMDNKYNNKLLKKILRNAEAEKSYIYHDEKSGAKYKVRTDAELSNDIIDYKIINSKDFDEDGIKKRIMSTSYGLKYDFSACMYQYIVHKVTGKWKKFKWVFLESEPPYDVLVVSSEPYTISYSIIDTDEGLTKIIEFGKTYHLFLKILEVHEECLRNNFWPGLSSYYKPTYATNEVFAHIPPHESYLERNRYFYS